jgi:hypothetical protein
MPYTVKETTNQPGQTRCPHCGAPLEGRMIECRYCRTNVRSVVSEEELRESCIALIESMNKSLVGIVSPSILTIFIIGVVFVPVAVYLLIDHYGGGTALRWGLSIFAAIDGMIVFGFILSREQSKMFERELKPRVQNFLRRHELEPVEFLSIARSVLKKGDPFFEQLDRLVD